MAESTELEEPIIWGRDLAKDFGAEPVVRKVNFDIPRGQIFGFIGPSGSGKTTTIRMLTGIYKPSSGEVRVIGKQPTRFTPHDREKIGYMPQHFAFYPDLTISENMNFAASIYGVGLTRMRRLKELLQFTELYDDRRKLVRHISGGMQRRLSLAATLIHKPQLLFLDEPTTGVDPVLRQKFWGYFEELRNNGATLFVTTQYVSEAAYCDLVGVMVEGNLLSVDTPEGLRRNALGGEVVILKIQDYFTAPHLTMIDKLPFVKSRKLVRENELNIVVDEASTAIPPLMEWCSENQLPVDSIQPFQVPFDDVFVALIKKHTQEGK